MKITLIKPNIGRMEHSLYVDEGRMEPLQLGVIAGMTPPDVDVALYDDRMEQIPYDEPTDLVAITVETYTARRAYEISAEFRRRGVPVIMGGMQATLIPEEVAEHADSIFLGDAEFLWQQVVDELRLRTSGCAGDRAVVGVPQPGTATCATCSREKATCRSRCCSSAAAAGSPARSARSEPPPEIGSSSCSWQTRPL